METKTFCCQPNYTFSSVKLENPFIHCVLYWSVKSVFKVLPELMLREPELSSLELGVVGRVYGIISRVYAVRARVYGTLVNLVSVPV